MLKIWARFIRLPNCFTAMADPMAGLAIATATALALVGYNQSPNGLAGQALGTTRITFDLAALGLTALAGFLIYAAGIIFNDLADLRTDRVKRPERALPSGQISVSTAAGAGLVLAGAGMGAAWLVAPVVGLWAGAVFGAVLVYDFLLKRWALTAAVGMGLCRALNLWMGMALPFALLKEGHPQVAIPEAAWLPAPVLYGLMIAFLTTLSWTEDRFPIKRQPAWRRKPEPVAEPGGAPAAEPAAPEPPPSLLLPKLSLWAWVVCLVLMLMTSTAAGIRGNPLFSAPGFVQYLAMLGVFIVVYTQFAIFTKDPTRPNLGMTIRNGVLSIPLMWAGVVFAFGARDPIPAHTDLPGPYLYLSLAIAGLYLPLIAAMRWLNTKDA